MIDTLTAPQTSIPYILEVGKWLSNTAFLCHCIGIFLHTSEDIYVSNDFCMNMIYILMLFKMLVNVEADKI